MIVFFSNSNFNFFGELVFGSSTFFSQTSTLFFDYYYYCFYFNWIFGTIYDFHVKIDRKKASFSSIAKCERNTSGAQQY